MKKGFLFIAAITLVVLVGGTVRDSNFWASADQRGDALFRQGNFAKAALTYSDPWRIGLAQYRNGDFEAAAKTFARVPGANGAFDQGNAWLMHGQYDLAVTSYDRALGFHPGWKLAEDNKALAMARKAALTVSDAEREQEQANAYKPDEVVFDPKGTDQKGQPQQITDGQMSDADIRATWLRSVQTTPADFLRAKFAFQASQPPSKETK